MKKLNYFLQNFPGSGQPNSQKLFSRLKVFTAVIVFSLFSGLVIAQPTINQCPADVTVQGDANSMIPSPTIPPPVSVTTFTPHAVNSTGGAPLGANQELCGWTGTTLGLWYRFRLWDFTIPSSGYYNFTYFEAATPGAWYTIYAGTAADFVGGANFNDCILSNGGSAFSGTNQTRSVYMAAGDYTYMAIDPSIFSNVTQVEPPISAVSHHLDPIGNPSIHGPTTIPRDQITRSSNFICTLLDYVDYVDDVSGITPGQGGVIVRTFRAHPISTLQTLIFTCPDIATCEVNITVPASDLCPNDPNKTQPGACGCGSPDIDSDGDNVLDCNDGCPNDPNKVAPGVCGCGVTGTGDTDGDGIDDCNDGCPNDPNKIEAGTCGCGNSDTADADGDGTIDCQDGCPNDANKIEAGTCGCGNPDTDTDGDGTPDCIDECPDNGSTAMASICGCEFQGIAAVEVTNIGACDGKDTADPSDDTFTGTLNVTFSDVQTRGAMEITGGVSLYYDFPSNNTSTIVSIPNVVFSAGSSTVNFVVNYVGQENCNYIFSEDLGVASCSPEGCPNTSGVTETVVVNDVNLSWSAQTGDIVYQVDYRKMNEALAEPWVENYTTIPEIGICDLKPDTLYEYRVRTLCVDNFWSTYLVDSIRTMALPLGEDCIYGSKVTNVQCQDNGTTSETDDYISFDLRVNNDAGGTYSVEGVEGSTTGNFNETTTFRLADGLAGNGDIDLFIIDFENPNCTDSIKIEDPGSCSNSCNLNDIRMHRIRSCSDRGTVFSWDDLFSATIDIFFDNIPSSGTLILDAAGEKADGSAFSIRRVKSVTSITGNTTRFSSVRFSEVDTLKLSAHFDADPDCVFEQSIVLPPNPCHTVACPMPTSLATAVTGNNLTLSWRGNTAILYEIKYRILGNNWITTFVEGNSFELFNILENHDYEFKMRAFCVGFGWTSYLYTTYNPSGTPSRLIPFNSDNNSLIEVEEYYESEQLQESLTLYPNPTRSQLTIEAKFIQAQNTTNQLLIYNLLGKVVLQKEVDVNQSQYNLDVYNLENGVYHLVLINGNQQLTQRFIKQ